MKDERIIAIESYIEERQVVTIKELCEEFGVSINTIRHDLNELQRKKRIKKVYGGAKFISSDESQSELVTLVPYEVRNMKFSEEKQRVAARAAQEIAENDVIFIDSGTSTSCIVPYLKNIHHLTIITNSVYVLQECLSYPNLTTIALPGILHTKTASLVGEQCLNMLDRYNISKAFMACSAISIQNGASNSTLEEYSIKKKVIEQCSIAFLLTDHSKFNKSSLMSFASLKDFCTIFSDEKPSDSFLSYFEKNGIGFILA